MTVSNANADVIRTALSLAEARDGTFSGLIQQLVGKERGRGADRKVYGNATMHYVLYTGFIYINIVRRSLDRLLAMDRDELVAEFASKGITDGHGNPITRADVNKAIANLAGSLQDSLDGKNTSTTDHVFEPLVVDGETVRGARVYRCVANDPAYNCKCGDCTGDKRAPVDGQISLLALVIGSKVIEPAPNGPVPKSKSRGDVVVKGILKSRLPIGRVRSFRLRPGDDYILRAGGAAATAANKDGVTVDADRVADLATSLQG
jgi:hypothetical protein